jgi:Tol biopolymer transport system component
MDGDGGRKKQLTFPPSGGLMPSLSPDMKHILYMAPGPGENPEVWLMNADGTDQHRLTRTTTTAVTRKRQQNQME